MTKTIGRTTLTYAYNDQDHRHAVTSITINGTPYSFTYDGNGNMQSGPDLTDISSIADRSSITYNADNMPKTIVHSTGGTVNLIYDGEGNRAKKTGNNSTTYYIGEHYEITDTGNTKYIFAGNLRLAKISAGGTFYFHKDHLNSSTVMSDETGIGSVETTEYMPFGSMRDHSGTSITNYKFTDQELDPETGLYNYRARLYDPNIGRFITPDSIIPDPYDPQSLNRYSYCRNNPLIYVDPSGQFAFAIAGLCVIGAKVMAAVVAWAGWEIASHVIGNPEVTPEANVANVGTMIIGAKAIADIAGVSAIVGGIELGSFAYSYGLTNPGVVTNAYDFVESVLTPGSPKPSWGGYWGGSLRALSETVFDIFDDFTSSSKKDAVDSETEKSFSYSGYDYGVSSTQDNPSQENMLDTCDPFSVDTSLAPSGYDSNDNDIGWW